MLDTAVPPLYRSAEKMKHNIIVAALVGVMPCCANRDLPPPPVTVEFPDWSKYAAEIATLAKAGTPKSEWDRVAQSGSATHIASLTELKLILDRYEDLAADKKAGYINAYSKAKTIIHYGLEGDYRALVFFGDDDRVIDAFLMGG